MDTMKIIIQALVVSKLDYCNSLLAGTAGYQLDKLQCIQYIACRVITSLHKYDHISENMMTLHWLKICERIMFIIALFVYKCRCGLAPKYLQELLPRPNKTRTLHSSYTTVMVPEFFKKEQVKSSSFSVVGPCIWNTLPHQVKTAGTLEAFKTSPKHGSSRSLTTSLKDQTTQTDKYNLIISLTNFIQLFLPLLHSLMCHCTSGLA